MKKLLFIFLLMVAGFASAQAKEYRSASYPNFSQTGGWYTSGAAACQADYAHRSTLDLYYNYNFSSYTDTNATSGACRGTRCSKSGSTCSTDPNAVWSSTQNRTTVCIAPKIWDQPSQTCIDPPPPPPPACPAGVKQELTLPMGTVGAPNMAYPTNVGGCQVVVKEQLYCESYPAATEETRPLYCRFIVENTGIAAVAGTTPSTGESPGSTGTPTSSPPHNPAQGQGCPKGTVQIGTDSSGEAICAGSGTAPGVTSPPPVTTAPPVTTNNPDGSTTETRTTTRENADGSTTTTTRTTVTNPDGTTRETESTTTGNNAAGGTGKSDPTKEEASDFCKKNPHLNACKNSTVSGSCESTSCEGDAIQCAILRQQRKEYCENTKDNPHTTLGNSLLNGNDPQLGVINAAFAGTTVDLSSQALDQNGFASGSCFPNRSINVAGRSVVVSFTSVCSNLQPLRLGILAISLLAAYLLVSKSVLQG